MAISLSDLTGASTSGNVLNEVNSYADFLDSVPRLVNKADPTGATDAVQTVATKQPVALPLIDGDGYLFIPNTINNYASTPDDSSLDITGDITIECDFIVPQFPLGSARALVAKYNTNTNNRSYSLTINASGVIGLTLSEDGTYNSNFAKGRDFSSVLSGKTRATIKVTWRQSDGLTQFFIKESDGSFTQVSGDHTIAATSIYNGNQEVEIGSTNSGASNVGSSVGVFGARIYASVDGTDKRLDVDFTSPRIPHGATEFTCETGQVVTVNTDGKNPAKVIKKPVLRFDGVNSSLKGFLGQTITSGYALAAFSVSGDGGDTYARIASLNSTGNTDDGAGGAFFGLRDATTSHLFTRTSSSPVIRKDGMFDDENGDILTEFKFDSTETALKVNGTTAVTAAGASGVSAEEFNIACSEIDTDNNAAIDLEYLALFPATLTDAQADQVRNFINNRNKVFTLIDSQGYYFFDGAATTDGQVFTGSGSWNGRIVGSDNGDSDFYINQDTLDDRPTTDGYKITFADNTDHFDIPSTSQAGWQIVGTSLGTFAYKVDSDAVSELNLLGNASVNTSYRKTGDLYGIILLPENATNRDIEEARKLLIDRGAADGVTEADLYTFWYSRKDIREFKHVDTSSVTDFRYAWKNCSSLQSFPLLDTTNATGFEQAFYNATSLSSFPAIQAPNCSNFIETWRNCSSLTQFAQDAKLGTEASNVNFTSAWQQSGLTSFSTPLPTATSATGSWANCTSLTSFNTELPLVTNASSAWYGCSSLESFSSELPLGRYLGNAWYNCSSLTDFSADVFSNWNPLSIYNGVFDGTWVGCSSLKATSVENILTSIAASGKWATTSGLEGGTALSDATIDIDYNVATGSLTAATLSAIETLNGRGWSVNINGVIQ